MKAFTIAALFIPFIPIFTACSGGELFVGSDKSASEGDPSVDGGNCSADTDCTKDQICGFASKDACSAVGRCFPAPEAVCEAYSAACACDGTTTNVACTGLPSGFTPKAIAHAGECDTGASDAGPGGACDKDSDCPGPNQACAYLESEGCAAHGVCVAVNTGPECAAYSAGCACDGTEINVACLPYPNGYDSKPLAYSGSCATDGGSGAADAGK